jgi:hypothetical protein
MSRPGVTRHPSGLKGRYRYRDVTIQRQDEHRGYWGNWYTPIGVFDARTGERKTLIAHTQTQLLAEIDEHLDANKVQP